jgi:DNA repair protein RadB
MRAAIGARTIDELLGGGFESGIITEIYGEAGTGKTNICLQLGKVIAGTGKKVAFIDTEGVSADRLQQICGGHYDEIMRNFLIYKPTTMDAMGRDLIALDKIPDLGLVVVDSVNLFTRLGRSDEAGYDRTFLDQMLRLQRFARERDIPILVTAQVYGSGSDVLPFSGRTMAHLVKTIIRLEKLGVGLRKAVIIKHRSQPESKETEFTLTAFGIV